MDESSTQGKHTLAVISNSDRATYLDCARKSYYQNEKRRIPVVTALPLVFGSVFHVGTDHIHKGRPWVAAVVEACQAHGLDDAYDQARVEAMLTCYEARYQTDAAEIRYLDIEKRLDAPVVNPATGRESRTFRFAGRCDAIVTLGTRGRYIFETKTTSSDISPGSDFWRNIEMKPQGPLYVFAERRAGNKTNGVLFNVARKPSLKPKLATPIDKRRYKKDGTLYAAQRTEDEGVNQYKARLIAAIMDDPDMYFQRHIIDVPDTSDAQFDLWNVAKSINSSRKHGVWPRNPDACFKWNRACQYFEVCTGNAGINDNALFRDGKARY